MFNSGCHHPYAIVFNVDLYMAYTQISLVRLYEACGVLYSLGVCGHIEPLGPRTPSRVEIR